MTTQWQPIETAPKDGTDILLYLPRSNRKIHLGHYHESETREHGKITHTNKAWWVSSCSSFAKDEDESISHRMPLPKAPE